jgi:hypothetical protein
VIKDTIIYAALLHIKTANCEAMVVNGDFKWEMVMEDKLNREVLCIRLGKLNKNSRHAVW